MLALRHRQLYQLKWVLWTRAENCSIFMLKSTSLKTDNFPRGSELSCKPGHDHQGKEGISHPLPSAKNSVLRDKNNVRGCTAPSLTSSTLKLYANGINTGWNVENLQWKQGFISPWSFPLNESWLHFPGLSKTSHTRAGLSSVVSAVSVLSGQSWATVWKLFSVLFLLQLNILL